MLEIRQENKKDYTEVYNVIKKAFMSAEHCDGNEQDLVVNLRESNNFIPELSLVAIDDNKIVGYILFTKIPLKFLNTLYVYFCNLLNKIFVDNLKAFVNTL